jgi:rare lipoprotein A
MRRLQRKLILGVSLGLLFSGCSSNTAILTPTAYPNRGQPRTRDHAAGKPALPDGAGGVYKTGKPYRVAGVWYRPMQSATAYDKTGIASWYGRDFHGGKTANGERYDMHALSAAHTTLPLPTLVRVTNLENGRSVVVRVNDRGPFVKSRLIDLSYAAARELGFADQGTARVRVQTLDRPAATSHAQAPPAPAPVAVASPIMLENSAAKAPARATGKGGIFVQLGAFRSKGNAAQLRDALLGQYPATRIRPLHLASQTLFRVRIGPFRDMSVIEQTIRDLQHDGHHEAIVIVE